MSSPTFFAGAEIPLQDFLRKKNYSQFILLADSCTNGFCVPLIRRLLRIFGLSPLIVIPRGETNKNLATCELIWEGLQSHQAGSGTLLVTIGGGMVSDIGAFAASVYKRGIAVMHIPTTLLAMVDASHGGKTGIDFMGIKNMIGTFRDPEAIYVQPEVLNTLDTRILRSGFAETIKHALIADSEWWHDMQDYSADDFFSTKTIARSIGVKEHYCHLDPFDKDIRQCLNFGHSLGHAIESQSLSSPHPLLHGEAVMLGMQYELRLSRTLLQLPASVSAQFDNLMQRFFPSLTLHVNYSDIREFLQQDKKNDHHFRMSLIEQAGKCRTGVIVSEQDIAQIIMA